jgi:hypothetical protein
LGLRTCATFAAGFPSSVEEVELAKADVVGVWSPCHQINSHRFGGNLFDLAELSLILFKGVGICPPLRCTVQQDGDCGMFNIIDLLPVFLTGMRTKNRRQ